MGAERRTRVIGIAVVAVLAVLAGWLGYRDVGVRQAQHRDQEMVQVARQGAVNLTSIDHERVEQDVARILELSTGAFHDDFAQRAQPFIDVAKRAQSKSVGTVTEAGLESVEGDEGRVLVTLNVMTSIGGAPEQQPRAWRMRLTVTRIDDETKVSKVEFIP